MLQNDLFAVVDSGGANALPFVVVEHSCDPRGKGRPRGTIIKPKGGKPPFISFYTDAETQAYESQIAGAARRAMRGNVPAGGPLAIRVFAMMRIPPSWSNREKDAALAGTKFHMSTPDTDNIMKAVLDAFNGIVWVDDKQVVRTYCHKEYAASPGIIAEVYRLP